MTGVAVEGDGCGDFAEFQITWSGHGLDRSEERRKSREEAEAVIRTSSFQQPARKGRCRVLGCVSKEMTAIVVKKIGATHLIVVSVVGYGKPCN
jgi:hypothetical protein